MALGSSRSAALSSGLLLVRTLRYHVRILFTGALTVRTTRQDPLPSPTAEPVPNGATRFRPYASPDHHVTKARYITSNDPRGYMCAPNSPLAY